MKLCSEWVKHSNYHCEVSSKPFKLNLSLFLLYFGPILCLESESNKMRGTVTAFLWCNEIMHGVGIANCTGNPQVFFQWHVPYLCLTPTHTHGYRFWRVWVRVLCDLWPVTHVSTRLCCQHMSVSSSLFPIVASSILTYSSAISRFWSHNSAMSLHSRIMTAFVTFVGEMHWTYLGEFCTVSHHCRLYPNLF